MKVKICCISSVEEAHLAIKSGATELGLVGPMPSGPGMITEEKMIDIISSIPNEINTFLLTSEVSAQRIILQHARVNTSTIQIVDKLESGTYTDIRQAIPGIKLVQVIHIIDEHSITEAKEIANEVDFLLLDSGNPNKGIKELGGTGRIHNWEISKNIVASVTTPVFLAGGLNDSNIRDAINTVKPFGVDLCSSVRTNGNLNSKKLASFFEQIKNPSYYV